MEKRVVIMGAGNFGQALAAIFQQRKGVTVEFWDKDVAKVPIQRDLPTIIKEAQIVFVCVPSWAAREALTTIRDFLQPEAIVVSPAQGIDGEHLAADQILEVVLLLGQPWALLSGPMLADEIQAGKLSFASLAALDYSTFEAVRDVFVGTSVRLEHSDDPHGVALAGVLKNVYAIGLGMVAALQLGNNLRGSLVMQSCREMSRVITHLGGRAETAWALAGLADLVATGFSEHSRNCRAGRELVELGRCETVSEGVESLPHLVALLKNDLAAYPVLAAIHAVVDKGMPAQEAITRLMAVRHEREKV